MPRLTKTIIATAPLPAQGEKFLWDEAVRGFGVRLASGGSRSFVIQYRLVGDAKRRFTIGRCDHWTLEAAREEAKELLRAADKNDDPAQVRIRLRGSPTMLELAEHWIEHDAPLRRRESTIKGDISKLRAHIIPAFGHMKVAAIRKMEIEKFHRRISSGGNPIAANRVIALMSVLFNYAIKHKLIADNPAAGVEHNDEKPRKRYLSEEEVAALWKALDETEWQSSADAIRLLTFTGARKMEVLALRWDELDLKRGIWNLPAAKTKKGEDGQVHLADEALELLLRRKASSKSEYVFPPRTDNPSKAISGKPRMPHQTEVRAFWLAICKRAGLPDVHIHDLRHTYASILVTTGHSLFTVGSMLRHSDQRSTARYSHLMNSKAKRATSAVAKFIKNSIDR